MPASNCNNNTTDRQQTRHSKIQRNHTTTHNKQSANGMTPKTRKKYAYPVFCEQRTLLLDASRHLGCDGGQRLLCAALLLVQAPGLQQQHALQDATTQKVTRMQSQTPIPSSVDSNKPQWYLFLELRHQFNCIEAALINLARACRIARAGHKLCIADPDLPIEGR